MTIDDSLSLQLYSLRDMGELDVQLDAAAAAGFKLVETVGGHLKDAQSLKRGLDARQLKSPSGHIGMADLRADLARVTEAAASVGIACLYVPALPDSERGGTAAQWRAVGEELGTMAHAMVGSGVQLGYHNHFWEFDRLDDGRTALENLFEDAAGSPLVWQADIAWVARAGADPIAWMNRYAALLTAVHVKDMAPAGTNLDQDGWADVGSGTLDWPSLWAAAAKAGAKLFVVEHDKPKYPAEFARASHDYLVRTIDPSR